MKHYTNIALILGCLIALFGFDRQAHAGACIGDAGVAIARAYAIAVSYPDRLPQFAEENAAFFGVNSTSIRCGRALITQLRSGSLSSGSSPDSIKEYADDLARRAGRPELAGPLADQMLGSSTDMLQLASFLENLIETLPDAARGNPRPYKNTLLYSTMNFVWKTSQQILLPENLKAIRDMAMEMNEWYVTSFAAAVR